MIQGKVGAGDPLPGIEGVCVSNGREVVRTDAQGTYELPGQSEDRFVFLTVPAGYKPAGSFYADLKRNDPTDFELREVPENREQEFSFVQVTDIHVEVKGRAEKADLVADLAQIDREVGDRAKFIVATGDLTMQGTREQFQAYLEAVKTSRLPVYHCIGNHDDNDPDARTEHFLNTLGPTYYSFDRGPVHFIAYDGVGQQWRDPDHQATWLRADLDLHKGRPIVFLNHFPSGSSFYDPLREDGIIATLSGHWHSTRVYRNGRTAHYNTPTLCVGGIDQSPRGYRLCTFRDGQLVTEMRAMEHVESFAGISYRQRSDACESGPTGALPDPDGDWPLYRGGAGRTGAVASGPAPPLALAWRRATGGGLHSGSPVVADGQVVIGTQHEDEPGTGSLVAFDGQDGTLRWSSETGGSIKLSPASDGGRIFGVTVTGNVMALDAKDGESVWTYQLGDPSQRWVYMSPLAREGGLYVGMSSHFVALDQESGSVAWLRDDLGRSDWIASYPSPAAWEDYVVIGFYGQRTNLAVLEAETGRTVWTNAEDKAYRVTASPVIGEDGTLYTVCGSALVRALDVGTGRVIWETPLAQSRCLASPALADGRLFVPSGKGTLHALDAASGQVLWMWQAGEGLASYTPGSRGGPAAVASPVVVGKIVYVGAADGFLYGLQADTGQVAWHYDLKMPILSSPAVSGSGLWTGACDGFLYAFSGQAQSQTIGETRPGAEHIK